MKMKVKKLTIIAVFAAVMLAGPAVAKDYTNIKIATEGAYKPWNFKDAAGNLVGFEIDYVAELCKRMGIKCTFVEQAWSGIIPSLQAGKYDAIIAGMSITAKRKKVISFSRDYLSGGGSFATTKSSPMAGLSVALEKVDLKEISADEQVVIDAFNKALDGKTVGVQSATTHENFVRKYLSEDITVLTYDTQENLDLDLQAGRVDAALASKNYWAPLLKSDKGKDFTIVGPNFSGDVFGEGTGAGVRNEDTELADMISKAINSTLKDGTCAEMAIKWFGFDSCSSL
jgi:octopine/nopaline transport system substrate-binding protein